MRPLRFQLSNFGPYVDLDLDVRDLRHVAVTGDNGAGKSFLADAFRAALFGHGRAPFSELVREGEIEASVAVEIEHMGREYRIQRTWRRPGKRATTSCEFMVLSGGVWKGRPKEDIALIFGLTPKIATATTFLASYGVHGIGSFGAATSTERRDILFQMRGVDGYKDSATAARRASESKRARADEIGVHMASIDDRLDRIADAEVAIEVDTAAMGPSRSAVAAAEAAVTRAVAAKAAGAAVRRELSVAETALSRMRIEADRTEVRREQISVELDRLADLSGQQLAIAKAAKKRDALRATWAEADKARQALVADLTALQLRLVRSKADREHLRLKHASAQLAESNVDQSQRLTRQLTQLQEHRQLHEPLLEAATAWDGAEAVELCREKLRAVPCGGEGEYAACRFIREAASVGAGDGLDDMTTARPSQTTAALRDKLGDLRASIATANGAAQSFALATPPDEASADIGKRLRAAGAQHTTTLAQISDKQLELGELVARIAIIISTGKQAGDIAARATVLAGAAAKAEALKGELGRLPDHQPRLTEASSLVEAARERLRLAQADGQDEAGRRDALQALRTDLTTIQRRIDQNRERISNADSLRTEHSKLTARRGDELFSAASSALLTTFYKEAPAIIIEHDLAAIEAATNDWLSRTSQLRVSLKTQRMTQSGSMREALDVHVAMSGVERLRETFSGSELFRVDIGLALGIGQALGLASSFLWLDEGFGTLRGDVIPAVAAALGDAVETLGGVWAISHVAEIVDLFPSRLVVSHGANGSTVEVIR